MKSRDYYVKKLTSKHKFVRMNALRKIHKKYFPKMDAIESRVNLDYNCRSFGSRVKRSPAASVFLSVKNNCPIASIVDFSTTGCLEEFAKACKICGLVYYSGVEVRASKSEMNYDLGIIGIPHWAFKMLDEELEPFRKAYENSYSSNIKKLDSILKKNGLSKYRENDHKDYYGVRPTLTTERLYKVLAKKIAKETKSVEKVYEILESLGVVLTEEERKLLADKANVYYAMDLTKILKRKLMVFKEKEYPPVSKAVKLADKYCSISSLFINDDKFDKAITFAKENGINSICVNLEAVGDERLKAFYNMCLDEQILPLARVIVDGPRFELYKYMNEETSLLYRKTTLAIVGHEIVSSTDPEDGFYCKNHADKSFYDRITLFSHIGCKGVLQLEAEHETTSV